MCALTEVVTLQEVVVMWGVNVSSVRRRLDRGHFRYRLTVGGRYLIDKASVVAVWGQPLFDDFSVVDIRENSR